MKRFLPAVLALVLVMTGCAGTKQGAPDGAPPLKGCLTDELPQMNLEKPMAYALSIGGTPLRPGQEFTLAVTGQGTGQLTRGIDAYLDCWTGDEWSPRYTLFSDRGSDGPRAIPFSPDQPIIDIGFDASRPGRFLLPPGLKPGWYRIRMHVSGTENGAYKPYQLWSPVEVQP